MRLNRPDFRVVMKVSESVTESGRCDFCQIHEAKHTINGGLWWLCELCMNKHFVELEVDRGEEE